VGEPLYVGLTSQDTTAVRNEAFDILAGLWPDMTEDVAHTLLRDVNWRSRIVGAHVAACKDLRGLTGWIGRLLLRSDACYAGRGYCVALAHFNTSESTGFLLEYLHYYLTRSDLWFDQAEAMAAIAYLDGRNGTSDLASMMATWETFVANKPRWDLDRAIAGFARRMAQLSSLSARCSGTAS
jgi:hypothetical protein